MTMAMKNRMRAISADVAEMPPNPNSGRDQRHHQEEQCQSQHLPSLPRYELVDRAEI